MKHTPDQLADLRKTHGDLLVLSSPRVADADFVFRRCGVREFDAYLATASSRDAATKIQANRQLAADLLVSPAPSAWKTLCEELPGLAHTFGDTLAEASGLNVEVVVGKG